MLWKNTRFRLLIYVSALSLAMVLAACGKEVSERETIMRGGLLYIKAADKPFSGYVKGKSREGHRTQLCSYRKEYKNGLLHGATFFWFPNGKLESKVPYKEGQVHGYLMRYWDNGKPRSRIHFSEGLRGGLKGEMYWEKDGSQVGS